MGGKAPGRAVLCPVSDVFGRIAPAVSVIAYGRNHRERRLAEKNHFHSHAVDRYIRMPFPPPCAVFNHLEVVCCAFDRWNRHIRCSVYRNSVSSLDLNNLCHVGDDVAAVFTFVECHKITFANRIHRRARIVNRWLTGIPLCHLSSKEQEILDQLLYQ